MGSKHPETSFSSPSDVPPLPSIAWAQLALRGQGNPADGVPIGQPPQAQISADRGRGWGFRSPRRIPSIWVYQGNLSCIPLRIQAYLGRPRRINNRAVQQDTVYTRNWTPEKKHIPREINRSGKVGVRTRGKQTKGRSDSQISALSVTQTKP